MNNSKNQEEYICSHCGKIYKTQGWLHQHLLKCKNNCSNDRSNERSKEDLIELVTKSDTNQKPKLEPKKKLKIAPHIRFQVWDHYIGDKIMAKCFCCNHEDITPFTNYKTFHTGHIISEYNGGKILLENLLPICGDCNRVMGTTNWDDYLMTNNLRPRIYGGDVTTKVIQSARIIQKMWRDTKNRYKIEVANFIKQQKNIKLNKKSLNKRIRKKQRPNYLRDTQSSIKKFKNKVTDDNSYDKQKFRF